ncbi:hypothetical protein [Nocardia sp. NPDC051833]|uniref:hypothetical protein n=1 Tax=Nocardia sp. NPDC051833 TaxID=3155674 RepID=UPI00342A731A
MYLIVPDPITLDQVAALPVTALLHYAEALSLLELKPWAGEPQNRANPDGAVRRLLFGAHGAGQLVYLVVEDRQEVHLLRVLWLD